ncbi:CASP-like protein 2D1 [Linum grandiflorum]
MAPIRRLKLLDSSLRLTSIPLSVAALWLTVANRQDNPDLGPVAFKNIQGLKYMAWISGISAAYAVIAAVSSWMKCFVSRSWLFFVSDQIVTYLMVTSGAGVSEIIYLLYFGDRTVGWSEACRSYSKLCKRMELAVILHALALLCFIFVTLISAYRAFSLFQPPSLPCKDSTTAVEDNRPATTTL